MSKGEIGLFIIGILLSCIWIAIFKNATTIYYILMSIYMSLGFLTLGYLDYLNELKMLNKKILKNK